MNRVITTSGITVIISPFRRKKKHVPKDTENTQMLKLRTEKVYVLSHSTNHTDRLTGPGVLSHTQFKQSQTSGFAHSATHLKIMH